MLLRINQLFLPHGMELSPFNLSAYILMFNIKISLFSCIKVFVLYPYNVMVTIACSLCLLWTRAINLVDIFNKYVNNNLDVIFFSIDGITCHKAQTIVYGLTTMCCQKGKFCYLTFQYKFQKLF